MPFVLFFSNDINVFVFTKIEVERITSYIQQNWQRRCMTVDMYVCENQNQPFVIFYDYFTLLIFFSTVVDKRNKANILDAFVLDKYNVS